MKRYLIEEIGSASSDEEEEQDLNKESQDTPLEDTSDLIQTLNHLSLPSQALVNHTTSVPIKTFGENTANSRTTEDHNHLTKPASTDEDDIDEASQHGSSEALQDGLAISKSSSTSVSSTVPTTCELTPPLTSIQFQATWKRLERNPELLYSYMKVLCKCCQVYIWSKLIYTRILWYIF